VNNNSSYSTRTISNSTYIGPSSTRVTKKLRRDMDLMIVQLSRLQVMLTRPYLVDSTLKKRKRQLKAPFMNPNVNYSKPPNQGLVLPSSKGRSCGIPGWTHQVPRALISVGSNSSEGV